MCYIYTGNLYLNVYIYLYVRTTPPSRFSPVLGFLSLLLGFLPNLQNPFPQAEPWGQAGVAFPLLTVPLQVLRPGTRSGKAEPHCCVPQPSPKHNRGGGCWRPDPIFGVCLLLLKLILSDGLHSSPQRDHFMPSLLGCNSHLPPESSLAAQAPTSQLSWPPLRCAQGAQGVEAGSLAHMDLRSECGWVLKGCEIS